MIDVFAWVWAAALLAAGANDTGQASPVLRDRAVLLVHLGPAAGPLDEPGKGRLLEALDRATKSATTLRTVSVSASTLDSKKVEVCAGGSSFGCWVNLARPGGVRPTDRLDPRAAPMLLVMNALGREGAEMRFAAFLLDFERASAIVEESSSSEDSDVVEGRIFDRALKSEVIALPMEDEALLAARLDKLFDGTFRGAFEAAGLIAASGSLTIETEVAGLRVELDGQSVGTTLVGRTTIEGVIAGRRRLHLVDPAQLRSHAPIELDLARGQALHLSPALEAASANPIRTATFWAGASLGVAGVAILVMSVVVPKTAVEVRTCVSGCPGAEPTFARSSDYFSAGEDQASGPQVAPLGYSLAGGGAAMALGTLFIGEPTEIPWIPIAMGIVVGGLGIGLSEALD